MAAQQLKKSSQGDSEKEELEHPKTLPAQFRTAEGKHASDFDPRDIPEKYHESPANKRRWREKLQRVQQGAAHLGQYLTDGELTEHVHWVMNAHRETQLHPRIPGDRRAKRRRRFQRQHDVETDT